jgi:hypothetical protein
MTGRIYQYCPDNPGVSKSAMMSKPGIMLRIINGIIPNTINPETFIRKKTSKESGLSLLSIRAIRSLFLRI